MGDLGSLGRLLLIVGGLIVVLGLLFLLLGQTSLPIGRLPGDIRIQRGSFSCFAPIATMILLSIILTVIVNVVARIARH